MRAVVITEHGGPAVLQGQERPHPPVGPGEVRISVRAGGSTSPTRLPGPAFVVGADQHGIAVRAIDGRAGASFGIDGNGSLAARTGHACIIPPEGSGERGGPSVGKLRVRRTSGTSVGSSPTARSLQPLSPGSPLPRLSSTRLRRMWGRRVVARPGPTAAG